MLLVGVRLGTGLSTGSQPPQTSAFQPHAGPQQGLGSSFKDPVPPWVESQAYNGTADQQRAAEGYGAIRAESPQPAPSPTSAHWELALPRPPQTLTHGCRKMSRLTFPYPHPRQAVSLGTTSPLGGSAACLQHQALGILSPLPHSPIPYTHMHTIRMCCVRMCRAHNARITLLDTVLAKSGAPLRVFLLHS